MTSPISDLRGFIGPALICALLLLSVVGCSRHPATSPYNTPWGGVALMSDKELNSEFGWRPLVTAPKNGTSVEIYVNCNNPYSWSDFFHWDPNWHMWRSDRNDHDGVMDGGSGCDEYWRPGRGAP